MSGLPLSGDSSQSLKRSLNDEQREEAQSLPPVLVEDSSLAQAKKLEGNGYNGTNGESTNPLDISEPSSKRFKADNGDSEKSEVAIPDDRDKVRGLAMIKAE